MWLHTRMSSSSHPKCVYAFFFSYVFVSYYSSSFTIQNFTFLIEFYFSLLNHSNIASIFFHNVIKTFFIFHSLFSGWCCCCWCQAINSSTFSRVSFVAFVVFCLFWSSSCMTVVQTIIYGELSSRLMLLLPFIIPSHNPYQIIFYFIWCFPSDSFAFFVIHLIFI